MAITDEQRLKKIRSILDEDEPIDKMTRPRYLNAVVFGEVRVGKTILGARMCNPDKPIMMMMAESGGWTLDSPKFKDIYDRVDPYNWKGLEAETQRLKMIREGHPKYAKYGAYLLDSATVANHIEQERIMLKPRNREEAGVPIWPDHNEATVSWRAYVKELWKADMDSIVVCHMREREDGKKGSKIRPDLPKQSLRALTLNAEAIIYLDIAEVKDVRYRKVTLQGSSTIMAGIRDGEDFPDEMLDDAFIEELRKWRAGESSKVKFDRPS